MYCHEHHIAESIVLGTPRHPTPQAHLALGPFRALYILLPLLSTAVAASQVGATACEWKLSRVNDDSIDLA